MWGFLFSHFFFLAHGIIRLILGKTREPLFTVFTVLKKWVQRFKSLNGDEPFLLVGFAGMDVCSADMQIASLFFVNLFIFTRGLWQQGNIVDFCYLWWSGYA